MKKMKISIMLSVVILLLSGCTSKPKPPKLKKSSYIMPEYFLKNIKTATIADLCGMNKFSAAEAKNEDFNVRMYNATPKEINTIKQTEIDTMNELKRRKAFSKREWQLIKDEKVKVGMSKNALICSWGNPESINRSSYGPDQYVYDGQYVYVRGNRVTAWN